MPTEAEIDRALEIPEDTIIEAQGRRFTVDEALEAIEQGFRFTPEDYKKMPFGCEVMLSIKAAYVNYKNGGKTYTSEEVDEILRHDREAWPVF